MRWHDIKYFWYFYHGHATRWTPNSWFDVCVTVHHRYNHINSQLDATITIFIDNYDQINMFRVIISPSSGALDCVYSLRYNAGAMLPAGDKDEVELSLLYSRRINLPSTIFYKKRMDF